MTSDIESEYDSDDLNFLSVDKLFDAVKKKSYGKTTTTRINNNDSSMQQYNITPFEDGNSYKINLNNIELFEFDNFNN